MKFLVAIALMLVVSVSAQKFQSGDSKMRTSCTYFADTLSLTCRGPSGTAQCEALTFFPMPFKIVGLGLDSTWTGENQFRIFPLRQDSTGWINHQFLTETGRKVSLSIHAASASSDEDGLSIRDPACFARIVDVFRSSQSNLVVPLKGLTADNAATVPQATLFGQIFFFDKSFPTVSKPSSSQTSIRV